MEKIDSRYFSHCGELRGTRYMNSFLLETGITLQLNLLLEISDKGINFLDTTVYKGERFHNQGILDIRTHVKPTETFQYTHFSFCNPYRVRKGLIKGKSLRLLKTNSSAKFFYENIYNLKKRLCARGYPLQFQRKNHL